MAVDTDEVGGGGRPPALNPGLEREHEFPPTDCVEPSPNLLGGYAVDVVGSAADVPEDTVQSLGFNDGGQARDEIVAFPVTG